MAVISGTTGDDILTGVRNEDNIIAGNAGNDLIRGRNRNDTLLGGRGDDTIFGRGGNDTLFGGRDNDVIFGGNGNDWLTGDNGSDVLTGGRGRDTFNFNAVLFDAADVDRVTDFTAFDFVELEGFSPETTLFVQNGADVEIYVNGDDLLAIFENALVAQVQAATTFI